MTASLGGYRFEVGLKMADVSISQSRLARVERTGWLDLAAFVCALAFKVFAQARGFDLPDSTDGLLTAVDVERVPAVIESS